jgi:hypothetical protein
MIRFSTSVPIQPVLSGWWTAPSLASSSLHCSSLCIVEHACLQPWQLVAHDNCRADPAPPATGSGAAAAAAVAAAHVVGEHLSTRPLPSPSYTCFRFFTPHTLACCSKQALAAAAVAPPPPFGAHVQAHAAADGSSVLTTAVLSHSKWLQYACTCSTHHFPSCAQAHVIEIAPPPPPSHTQA